MSHQRAPKTVVVIGAGVTGLTAAQELHEAGHRIHILERVERPGGAIRSTRTDGYLVEAGPNTMLLNDAVLLSYFADLGLADELVEASVEAKKRFIVRNRQPVPAPMSLGQFAQTPLLSAQAKWRLLAEPFVRRNLTGAEESVGTFFSRRLGQEVVDRVINPLIAGIYAGDPDKLSLRHAFPTLHAWERERGSLLRGAIAARRARRKAGTRFKSRSISFRSGLQAIIDALVRVVGDSLYTGVNIEAIAPGPPWRVRFARAGEPSTEVTADVVIVTTPGYAAAQLPLTGPAAGALALLGEIEYPPVTTVALGFAREQIAHPLDGYGALVPASENLSLLGVLFNSSLFPGRAPEGCVLLTSFLGGMRQPDLARLPDAQVQALVLQDLQQLLGVSGEPRFAQMTTWPRAIPQYNLGYARFHEAMTAAERNCPGLLIGGHVRDGVSVGDCIRAGWKLAERVS